MLYAQGDNDRAFQDIGRPKTTFKTLALVIGKTIDFEDRDRDYESYQVVDGDAELDRGRRWVEKFGGRLKDHGQGIGQDEEAIENHRS